MSTITKEWLQKKIAEMEAAQDEIPFGLDEDDSNTLAAMKLAQASLESEVVAEVCEGFTLRYIGHGPAPKSGVRIGDRLYTAPPAPVSVPDDVSGPLAHAYKELTPTFMRNHIGVFERYGIYPDGSAGIQAMRIALDGMDRRAAMLHGSDTELQRKAAIHDALCEKYNVDSLTDFVAWQRNHIAELEAAPPAPVVPGETAVMPDYPGYTMTQRECFQAGKKAGLAEAGNSPVIPDGWVMLPAEPTQAMMNAWLSEVANWRGHAAGYRAMIAAAPQQ